MVESERILLSHYNLDTLLPSEWPAEKDDSDFSEDEADTAAAANAKAQATAKAKIKAKQSRRYTTLERPSNRRAQANQSKGKHALVNTTQKDEPDPLGASASVIQVLNHRGIPVDDDVKLRNQFLLSSTNFSPSLFLSQVHSADSTESLLKGLDYLSASIEKKSASLKVLVESNFERFVRAKATIDHVYNEMRNEGSDHAQQNQRHSRQTSRPTNHARNLSSQLNPLSIPDEVRKNALLKESEYGVLGLKVSLLDTNVKAEEVWGPALGGREREEYLKTVLLSLESNRPLFETAASIQDNIKKGDYESLAQDYARAQRIANDAQQVASRSQQNQIDLSDQQIQQIIITARIWMDITDRIAQFKREIWRKLATTHFSRNATSNTAQEPYMELIAVLLHLGIEDNPIAAWLGNRYDFLESKIINTFERFRIEVEVERRKLAAGKRPNPKQLANHLKTASNSRRKDDRDMDTRPVIQYWDQIVTSLQNLLSASDGVLAEVIELWEITQAFLDGSKQRSLPVGFDGQSREHHRLDVDAIKELHKASLALFSQLREQVSALFIDPPLQDLSDLFSPNPASARTPKTPMSAMLSPRAHRFTFNPADIPALATGSGESWEKYAFWPPHSNSLSASTFLGKINSIIGIAACEMASIGIVKQDARLLGQLRILVGDVRERSITAICAAWLVDSESCRELEDWIRSVDKPDLTNLPAHFNAFQTSMLSNLQKIVYIADAADAPGSAEVVLPPPARHIETVQKGFKHSLYKAFSGMMEHAAKPIITDMGSHNDNGLTLPAIRETNFKGETIDARNLNIRKLLTISNFQALRNEIVPNLISQFENNFLLTISEDAKTARDVLSQMNARVFQAYVKPAVEQLRKTISAGIGSPTYAPDTARPSDARPYVYEVLLILVLVHTEVARTAPSLSGQILSYLLEQLSQALIEAFKLRSRYSLSALMQATLDVEFLAQTLDNYTTTKASEVQSAIYLALDERTDNEARQRLQNGLQEMRVILKRLRDKTRGEFGCFKKPKKDRREREKEKEKEKERERGG